MLFHSLVLDVSMNILESLEKQIFIVYDSKLVPTFLIIYEYYGRSHKA